MKRNYRVLSAILSICLLLSCLPVPVQAKSDTYWETTKDNVPLRYKWYEDEEVVSYVSKKGTVVKQVDKKLNLYLNTWYEARLLAGYSNNGKSGAFWIYSGNLTKHTHTLKAGACTGNGCDFGYSINNLASKRYDLKVTKDNAAVRELPYNDGTKVQTLPKGSLITAKAKVENYKGSVWYQLQSGTYIFSDNVEFATEKDVDANSQIIDNSNKEDFSSIPKPPKPGSSEFVPPEVIRSCKKTGAHKWSNGVCTACQTTWPLTVAKVNGTFKTNTENAVARAVPYKTGAVMKTYPSINTEVKITGVHVNSAKNTWYRTEEGYWIYGVSDVSMTDAYISASGYTFPSVSATWKPTLVTLPEQANIVSRDWASSNENVAVVNQQGVVTATGESGKATISCRVQSAEGTVIVAKAEVVMPETIKLEKWSYNNTTFEYNLALECSEYMCLAYPYYDYTNIGENLIVFGVENTSKSPTNLLRLLQSRGMSYQVSQNYYNKTRYNSPYVLASKMVNYKGTATPVIYVIIEGSAGRPGWEGNMMVSGTSYANVTEHETFRQSAEDILAGLRSYSAQFSAKPLVVVTGHSRGAAVGNLLAEELNREASIEKVYAYCFATPNATKDPKKCNNIFNICNKDDLVPYIPFSSDGWGFEKHGITYVFSSTQLYKTDVSFKDYAKKQMQKSSKFGFGVERNTPDYNYAMKTPIEVVEHCIGIWDTLKEYYQHTKNYECDLEAYEYFLKGLAQAAGGGSAEVITEHLHAVAKCVFKPLSWFFAANGLGEKASAVAAFNDSHQAFTYHAAMLSRTYNSSGIVSLFDTEVYGNGTVELNAEEFETLNAFFSSDENHLALILEGWDIEDPDTWNGVLWDMEGHIVQLDLSYLGLSGWLDVSGMEKLEKLDIDGNQISMLALGENENLTSISCFFNDLNNLYVQGCENLETLNCAYNTLETLDVSQMTKLEELSCYANCLTNLNLDGATALQSLDCSINNLTSVDVSTNTELSTFFCLENYIIESQCGELLTTVNNINEAGGAAHIGSQKYIAGYDFNAAELENLIEFANSALNLEKLGWNLEDPWNFAGVEWKIYGNEYHIASIAFDGLALEGDLNLPDAVYLENLSCTNASLSSMNLSGCSAVTAIDCYNAGVSSLELSGCTNLSTINCSENYLEIAEMESAFSQIGLQTGLATYENQNIGADEECFDENERRELINLLSTGSNIDILGWDWDWPGTWDGIIWTKDENGIYRVNKINFAQLDIVGELDLTGFDYLEDFDFSGTKLEKVILPDCITCIPAWAFYNSAVETVYLCDGVTAVGERSFAYCDNLRVITLPVTIAKIEDAAFQGCASLSNVVFVGDAPLSVGEDVFADTASDFVITIFSGTDWSEGTFLLDQYRFVCSEEDYVVLLDSKLALTTDDTYNPLNIYAGDTIHITLATSDRGMEVTCMLAVYNEGNGMVDAAVKTVVLDRNQTDIVFENVEIQYAGEAFCSYKFFLLSADGDLMPLVETTGAVLHKPVAD